MVEDKTGEVDGGACVDVQVTTTQDLRARLCEGESEGEDKVIKGINRPMDRTIKGRILLLVVTREKVNIRVVKSRKKQIQR